jgi:hypothetical protein
MMHNVCIESSHNNYIWAEEDLHTRVKQGYKQRLSITFWCGIGDFLIGPHIFSACLTGPVCRDLFGASVAGVAGRCAVRQSVKVWFIDDRFPAIFSMDITENL